MAENFTDGAINLLKRLGLSGEQLQNAKLGPGVVGRNSKIAYAFLPVSLVGVLAGAHMHSAAITAMSVAAGFLVAIGIPVLNVIFGHKNPAAAILEGAEFLQYHQIEMAAKGLPAIVPTMPPEPKPKELEDGSSDDASEMGAKR